jgi:hypothetical protein
VCSNLDALVQNAPLAESEGGRLCCFWRFILHTAAARGPVICARTHAPIPGNELVSARAIEVAEMPELYRYRMGISGAFHAPRQSCNNHLTTQVLHANSYRYQYYPLLPERHCLTEWLLECKCHDAAKSDNAIHGYVHVIAINTGL